VLVNDNYFFPGTKRGKATRIRAGAIVAAGLKKLKLKEEGLESMKKGDLRNVTLARLLRLETPMTLRCIAKRLRMGVAFHVANRFCWSQ